MSFFWQSVNDRARLTNRLTAALKAYFPQALAWLPDLCTDLACAFLTRWPTLTALQRARATTIEQFFRSHHSHGALLERRLSEIKTASPLVTDTAVLTAQSLLVQSLLPQLQATLQAIAAHEQEIERLCASHPDFYLFDVLPGAGQVLTPRLLAALGTQRNRFASAQALACFSGVAPVIERSGQSCWTRWRYFCPKFLRQTFVEFAGESVKFCGWAKAFYHLQRSKGKGHAAALRALAFKWIRLLWKYWQTRTPYDETHYLAQLRKTNSPLSKQNLSDPVIDAERGKPDLLPPDSSGRESKPQGKPMGGRVQDRGESQCLVVTTRIAVESATR